MSTYKAFLDSYIDAWNRQDIDGLLSYFTNDVTYIDHAIGAHLDSSTVADFLRGFIGNYPVGFKVSVTYVCEQPEVEKFSYEWDVEGASTEGVKMFIRGVSMVTMRGDKILRNVDYWDRADSPKAAGEERE